MKKISFILLMFLTVISCGQDKKSGHKEEVEQFQYKMNVAFSDKKTSPLKKKDFKEFKHLSFFPVNSSLKIVADFERTPNEPIFEMQTTTERKPLYTQFGIANFTIDDKEFSLRIYQNQKLILDLDYSDLLFIPFNDLTNGANTYGGGRYIDLKSPKGNTIVIDFNLAYNPYCAYNDKYSCPIPPTANNLNVKINAGVLYFKKS